MKRCPQCAQVYDDQTNFCLADGATLVAVSGSFTDDAETPTVIHGQTLPPTASYGAPTLNYGQPTFNQGVPPPVVPVQTAPEPRKSRALLIVLVVGLVGLVALAAIGAGLFYKFGGDDSKNQKTAVNTPEKSNKNADGEHKAGDDDAAANLRQQQEKLDRDKQKLEQERKALEEKKKTTPAPPPPSSARTAVIIDPPSNVRDAPNGRVQCVLKSRGTVVNILGSTGIGDNNGTWYYTDACGRTGVIHSSQFRF
ncbi:MAG: hypothetical protein JSS81_25145 [Acidobacteria bacterium]|nr:hypothetical protein [Acidobacteriota bacterium]